MHFLELHWQSCVKDSGSSTCISPSIHHLHVSLAQLTHPAAHQAQRPAGASSASSHGAGYSATIPDSERRVVRQYNSHDSGWGQFWSQVVRTQRRRAGDVVWKAEDVWICCQRKARCWWLY